MRLSFFAIAMGLLALMGAQSAEAKQYKTHGVRSHHAYATQTGRSGTRYARSYSGRHYARSSGRHYARSSGRHYAHSYGRRYASSSNVGGRPRQWCGWWMRTQKGGGPEYNLAANWRRWGSPSGPQVGAVVVWSHHVGIITGQASNGRWVVKSGNDGGQVRERARSVAGAVFRIG